MELSLALALGKLSNEHHTSRGHYKYTRPVSSKQSKRVGCKGYFTHFKKCTTFFKNERIFLDQSKGGFLPKV